VLWLNNSIIVKFEHTDFLYLRSMVYEDEHSSNMKFLALFKFLNVLQKFISHRGFEIRILIET